MATMITARVEGSVAADNSARVTVSPDAAFADRFSNHSRRPRTFRAATFKARTLAAALLAVPSVGGMQTTRVTGL